MSDIAIQVKNLSKRYLIGKKIQKTEGKQKLLQRATAPFQYLASTLRPPDDDEILWALKDVSLKVKHGEVIGLIGRNGAGKSTLLKILSRITEPTSGQALINGRVGSLLEVGTGFHPELTGRENIYMNGAIMGMKGIEIERKFDEIVAFSGVEKFIDTPVKRYSSGMYVRLAFSVAAHLQSEILLIDEVLAVGDIEFQRKCLGKMGDVAEDGRTVLFVSHNMGVINRLCPKSIYLSNGNVKFRGDTDSVINMYLKDTESITQRRVFFDDDSGAPIKIKQVGITAQDKTDHDNLDINDQICVEIHYEVKYDIKGANISFALKRDGIVLFRSWDTDNNPAILELRRKGTYLTKLSLPKMQFTPGVYSIYVAAGQPGIGVIVQYDDCITLELTNSYHDDNNYSYSRGGILIMPITWRTKKV
jgi:lipopolysaccharide transport system ATP-binding protein